jgi:HTH-type transcriptional regulator / antitoxin HigA
MTTNVGDRGMSKRSPAEVFPPGEFISDELEVRGWTEADLAEILGRPLKAVGEILTGQTAITPETATGLGEALGVDPRFWMDLESAYRPSRVRGDGGACRLPG